MNDILLLAALVAAAAVSGPLHRWFKRKEVRRHARGDQAGRSSLVAPQALESKVPGPIRGGPGAAACVAALLPVLLAADWAQPMRDVPLWATYEARRDCCGGIMDGMESGGMFKAFKQVRSEGAWTYWSFGVPLGTTVETIVLHTTRGTYRSDKVFFVSPAMKFEMTPCPAVAAAEHQLWRQDGEERAVAFAHFPTEPKGDVVSWDIEPKEVQQ